MKTRLWMLSIAFSFVSLSVAGCQTAAPSCAGWEKINLLPTTAVYLAGHDVTAGRDIASHNLHGRKAGCWR